MEKGRHKSSTKLLQTAKIGIYVMAMTPVLAFSTIEFCHTRASPARDPPKPVFLLLSHKAMIAM